MAKDRRGVVGITLVGGVGLMIVIFLIVLSILLGIAGLLAFLTKNFLLVIGGVIIVFGLLLCFKSRNPLRFFLITLIFGGLVIGLHYTGLVQQTMLGEECKYISNPYFATISCEPAGTGKNVGYKSIDKDGQWLETPKDVAQYTVYIDVSDVGIISGRQIEYYICNRKSFSSCTIHKTETIKTIWIPGIIGGAAPGTTIQKEGIVLSDISGDKYIWAQYQKTGILGISGAEGAKYDVYYIPFILWREDRLKGGKQPITDATCEINRAKPEWVKRVIESDIGLKEAKDYRLKPYEVFNYISSYVAVPAPALVEYKGELAYCRYDAGVARIFPIKKVQDAATTYCLVDTDWNSVIGTEECCPGDKLPNKFCNNNFKWEEIEVDEETGETNIECDIWNPCSGSEWSRVVGESKLIARYTCVNNKCVREIKEVECTVDRDCGTNERCSTLTWTCVRASEVETGEEIREEPLSPKDCRWYERFVSKEEKKYKLWNYIGIGEPETIQINECVTAEWVYLVIVGVFLMAIIFILLITKRKQYVYPPYSSQSYRRK